jgi:3-methyladenine DNA glycosylase/8-oxoguanine DNA glycosylase
MARRFALEVPRDFYLKRDVCSYGYFLLYPNNWSPADETFSRILDLEDGPATLLVVQPKGPGSPLKISASRNLGASEVASARQQLSRMFRLDEDETHADRFHSLDPRFKESGRFRLFRSPTLFEDVIKTVTSCNVTWSSTILMNRRLCEVFGRGSAFPSASKLGRTAPAMLRGRCSVGYRDQRIVELSQLFAAKPKASAKKAGPVAPVIEGKGAKARLLSLDAAWFEDPATPDDAIHDALLYLPGIGPYAAANIMQLLGRYSRLPLDTESVRHGKSVLKFKGSSAQIMKRVHKHFAPMKDQAFRSYWFELWQFYESKHGPAWTWQRDSTGKLFTAAHLND